LGDEAVVAVPKINAFAGAVGEAAQQLWELARAKQAAALAELRTERENVSRGVADAQLRTRGTRRQNFWDELNFSGRHAVTPQESWNRGMRFFSGEIQDLWTGGEYSQNQQQAVDDGIASLARLDVAIAETSRNLEQFAKPEPPRTGGAPVSTRSGRSGSGRSAEAEARRLEREQEREQEELKRRARALEDDLYRAGDALLQAMMERQLTAQERLDLDLKMLERDREANKREIDRAVADGERTELEGKNLKELEDAVYNERVANRQRQGQQDIREEQLAAEQALLDMQLEMLQISAGSARTAAESRRVQLEILQLQQERARAELEARIAADPSLDGDALRNQLGRLEKAQTAAVIRNTQDPLEQWFDETLQTAEEVREAYQQVAADGLDRITNSLVDVITGTKSVKEAFAEMALSIIADIARIQTRAFVANIISAMFPGSADVGGKLSTILSKLPGKKGGGLFSGRGTGTSDSNLVRISDGEYVVKERATRKYKQLLDLLNAEKLPAFRNGGVVGAAGAAGALPSLLGGTLTQYFMIDAKGAVLADQLLGEMDVIGATHAANAGISAVAYQQAKGQRAANRQNRRFL
jgi:hypothetical protein